MTTTVDAEQQQQQVQQLVDHSEITNLVYRLGLFLDDRRFDEMRSLLIEEATVRTPGGTAEGREALIAQASRNHHPDEPTQHIITNVLVELDGDRAEVRANLVVNFAAPASDEALPAPPRKYALGETYHFDVVRTSEGWRFSGVDARPVWISPLSAAFLAAALRRAGSPDRSPQPT
ncbi:MAG TPA: nuclear transport factor 2 family protein [Acidimicrobiales bacterium]|nr:nuclear transport factor 2 family protein [Acidimicrobiales bacterium]